MATGLSDNQLRIVRSWVGDDTEEAVLHERYIRLGDLDGVVLEELRSQLSALLNTPSTVSVDGISVSFGANIEGLRNRINDFIKAGGTQTDDTPPPGTPFGVHKLVRDDVR